jgi:hypothetical protein
MYGFPSFAQYQGSKGKGSGRVSPRFIPDDVHYESRNPSTEQAESNPDSRRVFTTEKWSVQLDTAAREIACCSKCSPSGKW